MTIEKMNNTLLRQLLVAAPEAAAHLEQITVSPGQWLTDAANEEGVVYFPEDCLISLMPYDRSTGSADNASVAVVGHGGFWGRHMSDPVNLQASVLVGGHVYRVNARTLQTPSGHSAAWLMGSAMASQRLIQQMANLAFCAHHHDFLQRMASWLLVCNGLSNQHALHIRLHEVRAAFKQAPGLIEATWLELAASSCIHRVPPSPLLPEPVDLSLQTWGLEPARLKRLACSCHRRIHPQRLTESGFDAIRPQRL